MADSENGNGNGNGKDNGKGNEGNQSLDLSTLNEGLKGLPNKIQEAVQEAVVTALNTVKDESNVEAQKRARDAADKDDDTDVETMSNKELSDHILKQVTKAVGQLVKPLSERITGVQSGTEEDRIRAEAIAIAKEDPLFTQMGEEMAEVAKRHPDLSVRDIYSLAKINNPDKVNKLEEALKDEEEKKKSDAGEAPAAFGGFLPTSGVKSSIEGVGKMNAKEAANKAFDEVMKDIPAHILSGDTN